VVVNGFIVQGTRPSNLLDFGLNLYAEQSPKFLCLKILMTEIICLNFKTEFLHV
jgi:hypothetical protein